jgi:poly(3-hydroxybutyrate) depolymerase
VVVPSDFAIFRGPWIPAALGLIAFASGAAGFHEAAVATGDEDWWLLVRTESKLLAGSWLVIGIAAHRARIAAIAFVVGITCLDIGHILTDREPRPGFGRIPAGPGWVLGADALILLLLSLWRPAEDRVALIDVHPWRVVGAFALAAAVGHELDRSGIGQFPILVTSAEYCGPPVPLEHLVYLPRGYHRSFGRWPLILALHGSGTVGRDLRKVEADGFPNRAARGDLPFIVVAPQSPHGGWDVKALDALLDRILATYRVDSSRVYLSGLSMGGYGAWALGAAHPERFAAIAPICGGGDVGWAESLSRVPIWAFHGDQDRVIPLSASETMVDAINKAGGEAQLTVYRGVGHDAWTRTYDDPGFYTWLLAHRRGQLQP